jgi:hypothetical protein
VHTSICENKSNTHFPSNGAKRDFSSIYGRGLEGIDRIAANLFDGRYVFEKEGKNWWD